MIKTEFIELYESLSKLNEATDFYASKSFWDKAKIKVINDRAFHAAYDNELKELGLMDIFNDDGTFTGKSVYGKIKEAKENNPDSWAVKALMKLWTLKYVDNILFEVEKAKIEEETHKTLIKEYTDLLPEALAAVDSELLESYLSLYKTTTDNIIVEIANNNSIMSIRPSANGYPIRPTIKVNPNSTDKLADLINLLTTTFKAAAEEVAKLKAEKEERERKQAEERQQQRDDAQQLYKKTSEIDVIRYIKSNWYCWGIALLLGESGKLYHLYEKGGSGADYLAKRLNREVATVKSLKDISESYKVIYTCVNEDEGNHWGGKKSYTYYSWDSSEQELLKPILPEAGSEEDVATSRSTYSANYGNGKTLSLVDNIDTWYITSTSHWSLD